jgi:hypothetical protein
MFGVERVLSKIRFLVCCIARFKEASIADNVEHSNGVIQWNIVFTHLIHDWEVEVLASFYRCLYSYKFRGVGEDKLW